jgi:hypothetical protein
MSKPYWRILLERIVLAAILVFATYNISGASYGHWLFGTPFEGLGAVMGVLKILIGIVLLVGFGILLRATWRATGFVGVAAIVGICAAFVWLLQVAGWINLGKPTTSIIAAQIVVILIMAIGSTWSIFWKRGTGQVQVEDADTPETP